MKKDLQDEHLINGIDPYDFTAAEHEGARVYTKVVPWSSCIYVRFLFHFGAMHDPHGKEGLAHFLEHMLFTGTPSRPTKMDIDQFSKVYALDSLHAYTGFNQVCLYFRTLPENLDASLDEAIEMLTESILSEEAVEKEKKIIVQEAWRRYKNETHLEYRKRMKENIFQSFPDRLRIDSNLGWPDTIENITREDLVDAAKRLLVRENLSIVVAGNIEPVHIDAVRQRVSRLPSGKRADAAFVPDSLTPPLESVWIKTYGELGITPSKQASIEVSCAIPLSQRTFSVELQTVGHLVLRELLFRELRHKNSWCYETGAGFGNTPDYSNGYMDAKVSPDHIVEAAKAIKNVVQEVLEGKHAEVFEQERALSLDRRKAAELTTANIIEGAVSDLEIYGTISSRKEAFEDLRAATFEDLQAMLKVYFVDSTSIVCEIIVPDAFDKESIRTAIEEIF